MDVCSDCTSLQSKSLDWFLYDRDLHHGRVKCFPIHEKVKRFWRHQIYKHQNITSGLVFTIVFRIHYSFFIALPIRLYICRSNDFFLFSLCYNGQCVCSRKIGCVSETLCAQACPISTRRVIYPDLMYTAKMYFTIQPLFFYYESVIT